MNFNPFDILRYKIDGITFTQDSVYELIDEFTKRYNSLLSERDSIKHEADQLSKRLTDAKCKLTKLQSLADSSIKQVFSSIDKLEQLADKNKDAYVGSDTYRFEGSWKKI